MTQALGHSEGPGWGVGGDLDRLLKLPRIYKDVTPHRLYRILKVGLLQEGRKFKTSFRDSLATKFKTDGGRRVGNAFKIYVSGRTLDDLTLGIFTRWDAAAIYETGGVIRPRRGNYLAFPVTPRAYTAHGRIKRTWRIPGENGGKWDPKHFKDLVPIKLSGGRILLVRERGVTKKGNLAKVRKSRGVQAIEPMFILIRRTDRKPVLEFYSSFARMAGSRNARLQRIASAALQRIADEI